MTTSTTSDDFQKEDAGIGIDDLIYACIHYMGQELYNFISKHIHVHYSMTCKSSATLNLASVLA